MNRPSALVELLGKPLPDVTLPDQDRTQFPLRGYVDRSPCVLFVYIRNGTPG